MNGISEFRHDGIKKLPTKFRGVFKNGAVVSLFGICLGALSLYALHFFAAKELGAHGYGYLALSLTVVTLASMSSQLGFHQGIVKLIGAYSTKGEHMLLHGAIKGATILVLSAGICIAFIGMGATYAFGPSERELLLSLEIAFITIPAVATLLLVQNVARGFRRMGYATLPYWVFLPLTVLVVCFFMLKRPVSAHIIVGIYGLSAFIIMLIVYWRVLKFPELKEAFGGKPRYEFRNWLNMSLPMLVTVTLNQLLQRSDVLILALYVPVSHVGVYALASRLSQSLMIGNKAFNRYWASSMAGHHALGEKNKLQKVVSKTARCVLLFSSTIMILMVIFGKKIIAFFGPDFSDVYSLMVILIIGYMVRAYFAPSTNLLQMADQEKTLTRISLIVCALVFASYFVVIPVAGVMGAAVVTSTGLALLAISSAVASKKLLNCNTGAF